MVILSVVPSSRSTRTDWPCLSTDPGTKQGGSIQSLQVLTLAIGVVSPDACSEAEIPSASLVSFSEEASFVLDVEGFDDGESTAGLDISLEFGGG